ncbi:MAG: ABC transporter ATP-binding protein [Clostridiales bacterium]|nr:ABC transporter ATP-binding protein [Clostridiales bacterium]
MKPTIAAKNICRTFKSGHEKVHALKDVSIDINAGEVTLLIGRSGSGKTTLLNILGAMDTPNEGEVIFEERNIASLPEHDRDMLRRCKMGFVFQSIALISLMSAYENIDFALRISGYDKKQRKHRTQECLTTVGLANRANHRPAELSGGEQQRVAIARAISHKPKILYADEPTAELDTHLGLQVVKVFRKMAIENNIAVVMTSHDPNMVELADHIYKLEDGKIVSETFNEIKNEDSV